MGKQKYLWMAVTADKYELPLAVTDTAKELGRIYGLSKETIKSAVTRQSSGTMSGRRFVKVDRE